MVRQAFPPPPSNKTMPHEEVWGMMGYVQEQCGGRVIWRHSVHTNLWLERKHEPSVGLKYLVEYERKAAVRKQQAALREALMDAMGLSLTAEYDDGFHTGRYNVTIDDNG